MRKSAVLMIAVFGILVFIGMALTQSLVIIQRIATASEIAGDVFAQKRGQSDFVPMQKDTPVLAGTVLKTGATGGVTLNWADGSRIRMAPNTKLRVRKCNINTSSRASTSLFELDAGKIWIRVLELLGERSKFEIRTPTATAGVRGTVFSVEVDPTGGMKVEVFKGAVEVAGGGQKLMTNAGQSATIAGTSAATAGLAPADMQRWETLDGIAGPRLTLDGDGPIHVSSETISVTIAGISEPGASIMVDNRPVDLDTKNRFSREVAVPADAGDFDVVVTARDGRGGVSMIIAQVQRSD